MIVVLDCALAAVWIVLISAVITLMRQRRAFRSLHKTNMSLMMTIRRYQRIVKAQKTTNRALSRPIARLREDAHNETGTVTLYARELLQLLDTPEPADRGSAEPPVTSAKMPGMTQT